MKPLIVLAAALAAYLLAPTARACDCGPGTHQNASGSLCLPDASPKATAKASAAASATASARQTDNVNVNNTLRNSQTANGGAASQSQTANGGASTASNAGNSQSSTYIAPRQAVDGYSSGTNSTAACTRDVHAGIGAVIGGLSFGHGKRDHDCARETLALELWAHGDDIAAERVYCTISEVHAALGDDCAALLNQRHDVPRANAGAAPVTQEQLRAVEDRITTRMVSK